MFNVPGTSEGDDSLMLYSQADEHDLKDEICVLTMENVWNHNSRDFLVELLSIDPKNQPELREKYTELKKIVLADEPPSVIQFCACKHVFSAVPLLFNIMGTCLKCPVCRHGSKSIVDLDASMPAVIEKNTWDVLCGLAHVYRKRVKFEEELQEQEAIQQLAFFQYSMNLQEELRFSVIFSVNHANTSETPQRTRGHIIIGIPLRLRSVAGEADLFFDSGKFLFFVVLGQIVGTCACCGICICMRMIHTVTCLCPKINQVLVGARNCISYYRPLVRN